MRADGLDGTHEGVILSASKSPDGQVLTVETADGGQTDSHGNQSAKRQVRRFMLGHAGHPVEVQSALSNGWLVEWIAVGGDGPDEVLDGPGPAPMTPTSPVAGTGGAPVVDLTRRPRLRLLRPC